MKIIDNFDPSVFKLRIKDLREDKDITQKEIAEFLNCDQSLYSKYELDKREIPRVLLIKLAMYYNVSMDYIMGISPKKQSFPGKRANRK